MCIYNTLCNSHKNKGQSKTENTAEIEDTGIIKTYFLRLKD